MKAFVRSILITGTLAIVANRGLKGCADGQWLVRALVSGEVGPPIPHRASGLNTPQIAARRRPLHHLPMADSSSGIARSTVVRRPPQQRVWRHARRRNNPRKATSSPVVFSDGAPTSLAIHPSINSQLDALIYNSEDTGGTSAHRPELPGPSSDLLAQSSKHEAMVAAYKVNRTSMPRTSGYGRPLQISQRSSRTLAVIAGAWRCTSGWPRRPTRSNHFARNRSSRAGDPTISGSC